MRRSICLEGGIPDTEGNAALVLLKCVVYLGVGRFKKLNLGLSEERVAGMGLFDVFKKKKSDSVEDSGDVLQEAPEQKVTEKDEESLQNPQAKKEGGFFSGLKSGISSALKAVGIGGWKAKQVKDLQPNFTSEDPLEHVLVLNKASAAFGGLKNLGIYADITKITFSHALKVSTEDDFVKITIEDKEMPGQELCADNTSGNPLDFDYDELLTRECPSLESAREPNSVIPYSA